jgi:hypothetical protein
MTPAEFTPISRPTGYPLMEPRACFRNCLLLAASSPSLLYGEGYALMPHDGDQAIWIHHAWLIDPDRNAIDVTWPTPGARYIGIAVSPDDLMARQFQKERHPDLVEPVLATVFPIATDLQDVTWELAGWFTGEVVAPQCPEPTEPCLEDEGPIL